MLATKVRTEGYNAMLAELKQGLAFQNPRDDTWILKPADSIDVDSRLDRMARDARQYLERVTRDHPGTPWALLAQYELKQPLGWKWTETYTGVNKPRPSIASNNNAMPRNDRRRQAPKPPTPPRRKVRL